MSAINRRGFIIFGGLVFVTAVFCLWLPFFALPSAGLGVGLPWITLPADVLWGNVLPKVFGSDLVNSMTSLAVVDVILLIFGIVVNRAVSAQGIDRFIPRGLTNFIDLIVEFFYNQAHNVLGKFTGRVLPMALTVFMFVLVANWINLIPGFETVGIISCAEPGIAGYPLQGNGPLLNVNGKGLKDRAGIVAKVADSEACEAKYNGTNGNSDFRPPVVLAKAQRGEHAAGSGDKEVPAATKESGFLAPTTNMGTTETLVVNKITDASTAKAETGANAELFNVIPYFRQLATDLNMPLALAIIVFFTVQIWGIGALGGSYFFKFFNIPALGNISKNPMGVMDFVVGIVDIISELSRLISLSFRLLGNIFAGGVLLAVMTFLVAGVLPFIFSGLELFVGLIQAYVFATLTIMYASQAMFAHHSEDEHDSEHEAAAAHAPAPTAQPVDVP
ncbi:MAG: F0F1 ATP synthase subunit A [Chloroflexota bacterium]